MKQKINRGLLIDKRIIPDIFSFNYPHNPWIRALLLTEMLFAVVAVVGTLFLVLIFPKTTTYQSVQAESATTTQSAPTTSSTK